MSRATMPAIPHSPTQAFGGEHPAGRSRHMELFRPHRLDGVRVKRVEREENLWVTFTNGYSIVAVYEGAFDDWYRGRVRTRSAGELKLKEPGEVHRDMRVHAPFTLQVAIFEPRLVEDAAAALGRRRPVHFRRDPRDGGERATQSAFAMHAALSDAAADPFQVEARVAETLGDVLVSFDEDAAAPPSDRASRPVRRARDYLHDALQHKVTLDELATHAGMDKFHLVRAFRQAMGLAPYEYLTHLRIARAADLLASGVSASETAQVIGLYDQSLLNRHFRRIVGTTPGRYASAFAPKKRAGVTG